MTATFFIISPLLLAGSVMAAARRHFLTSLGRVVLVGLPLWLLYVGLLSWTGTVAEMRERDGSHVHF